MRKPAHLEYIGGKSPRQSIWETIRACSGTITIADIAKALPTLGDDTIRQHVTAWQKSGHIIRTSKRAVGVYADYRIANDVGVEAPRVTRTGKPCIDLANEQIWRTLRIMKEPQSAYEIAALASTKATQITVGYITDYLLALYRAGYLKRARQSKKMYYMLIKDTGPRPPIVRHIGTVYDTNLGKIVWQQEIEE